MRLLPWKPIKRPLRNCGGAFTPVAMEAVWTQTLSILRQRLEPGYFKVWIETLVGRVDGPGWVVHAMSSFAAEFVRDNFLPQIRAALAETLGHEVSVRVTDEPASLPEADTQPAPLRDGELLAAAPGLVVSSHAPGGAAASGAGAASSVARRPPFEGQHPLPLRYDEAAFSISVRSWRHSFEDFVVGPCNEMAFAASRSICKENRSAGILFLSSATGLGKTHLMQAAGRLLCKECNYRVPKVEYLTAEEFTSRLVMAIRNKDTGRFKSQYRDVDVLLLEDVHFLQGLGKGKTQEELLATLKTLHDRGSKIILSSSFTPRELRDMNDQLLSRFHSGFLAVIERPDQGTRKRIFEEKARLSQVCLPGEVSDFLAANIDKDVRQIESCLQNLVLKARLLKSGITMQMAWEAVQHYAPCEKKLDLEGIIAHVSHGYGISAEQLRSKSRRRELVVARNTVFFLARKYTDLSLEEIGNVFDRSHSTVIKGITSLEREMSRETSLGRQMAGAIALIERSGGIISPSA